MKLVMNDTKAKGHIVIEGSLNICTTHKTQRSYFSRVAVVVMQCVR